MIRRAYTVWLLLLVIAIVAGGLRAALLEPRLGEPAAHVAGTLTVVAVFAAIIRATLRWIVPGLEASGLWKVGGIWCASTVGFEFVFGRFVMGHSWARLLADYDLLAGRVWVLVLAVILFLPPALGRSLRRRR